MVTSLFVSDHAVTTECRRQGIVSGGLREREDLKLGFQ